MCKNPPPECKPIVEGNPPPEEDQDYVTSEDDSDYTDSDNSYFTESSVNIRTDSDSDAESASGNRVTPKMVLLLMLKEQGAITEEQYAEKAEKCMYNFRSLMPSIPKSSSVGSFDYTKDLSDSDDENSRNETNIDDDFKEKLLKELIGDNSDEASKDDEVVDNTNMDVDKVALASKENVTIALHENNANKSQDDKSGETPNASECSSLITAEKDDFGDKLTNNECVQEVPNTVKSGTCDLLLNNKDTSQNDVNIQCNGEISHEKYTNMNTDRNDNEDTLENTKHEEANQNHIKQQKTIITENLSCQDFVHKMAAEDSTKVLFESVSETINTIKKIVQNNSDDNNVAKAEERIIETNNNASQDTTKKEALIKTGDETKSDNLSSKNKVDPVTGKITKSFKYILNKLVRENRITEEPDEDRINDEYGEEYSRTLRHYARGLDDHYKDTMTGTKIVAQDSDDDEYDDDDGGLKEFALYLNFYSPSSYKYILETFNTPLPEHKVLCSWYLKDDHEPGLTEAAFKILKQKSSAKRLTCSLMFIDIFLKNDSDRYYDSVDYGAGPNDYCMDKAVLAYVFVLVSLDEDWKMPIGYLYARNVPAETQAELVRVCLTLCYDAGADVVAVTMDSLTPAEFLGCSFQDPKNLKTTFKHPVCDREVAVWIEPCLALKSARQTLKVKGSLLDDRGDKIRWNLIRKLIRLPSDDASLEKPEFFELRNHVAKIGLTSEIFSKSLAEALRLAEELLPDMFIDTVATQRYIYFVNMIYDLLNCCTSSRMSLAYNLHNDAKNFLLKVFCNEENGLTSLDRENLAWDGKRKGYRYFLKGEAACGLLGFLICIESFKHLYGTLVEKEKRLTRLNLERLCKVHAENFVTCVRARVGWDPDRFSGEDFQRYYRELFDFLEKNPAFSDRSVPLEHWPLRDRYSPAVTIKLTSGKRSYDDVYSSQYRLKRPRVSEDDHWATKVVRRYSKALDTETDLSIRKNMVGYIAGWMAVRFAKCLRCEACIDSLCARRRQWFHKFITLRQNQSVHHALVLPGEEIFRICWECERALRVKGSLAKIRALVLRSLAPRFPWSLRRQCGHPAWHHTQLIRAVIAKYVPLRIPAQFSCKDRKRIIELYDRFTKYRCDEFDELADYMNESAEENEDPCNRLF